MFNQGDYVWAWNYATPDKKCYTRFLHRLEGITPSNVVCAPGTIEGYDKGKIQMRRFDMVVPARPPKEQGEHPKNIMIDGVPYSLTPV